MTSDHQIPVAAAALRAWPAHRQVRRIVQAGRVEAQAPAGSCAAPGMPSPVGPDRASRGRQAKPSPCVTRPATATGSGCIKPLIQELLEIGVLRALIAELLRKDRSAIRQASDSQQQGSRCSEPTADGLNPHRLIGHHASARLVIPEIAVGIEFQAAQQADAEIDDVTLQAAIGWE
jgi:hypothetical protein